MKKILILISLIVLSTPAFADYLKPDGQGGYYSKNNYLKPDGQGGYYSKNNYLKPDGQGGYYSKGETQHSYNTTVYVIEMPTQPFVPPSPKPLYPVKLPY